MMAQEALETIIEVYEHAKFSDEILIPKKELSNLFHIITGRYIIWSYGYREAFKKAYDINKDALRKALIALLERSNRDFQKYASKYPSLKEEYNKKITVNKELIERLRTLW